MFEYECPHCGEEMFGSFGDDVFCKSCAKTYETDFDTTHDGYIAWITKELENIR